VTDGLARCADCGAEVEPVHDRWGHRIVVDGQSGWELTCRRTVDGDRLVSVDWHYVEGEEHAALAERHRLIHARRMTIQFMHRPCMGMHVEVGGVGRFLVGGADRYKTSRRFPPDPGRSAGSRLHGHAFRAAWARSGPIGG
jgi:hypothetical protein